MSSTLPLQSLISNIKSGDYTLFGEGKMGIVGKFKVGKEYYVFKFSSTANFETENECKVLKDLKSEIYNRLEFIGCTYIDIEMYPSIPTSIKNKNLTVFMRMIHEPISLAQFQQMRPKMHILMSIYLQLAIIVLKLEQTKGLVHYDLHANNIMLTMTGNNTITYKDITIPTYGFTVVIIDFGLARTNNSSQITRICYPTVALFVYHTPLYCPLMDWYMILLIIASAGKRLGYSKLEKSTKSIIDLRTVNFKSKAYREGWYVTYTSLFCRNSTVKRIHNQALYQTQQLIGYKLLSLFLYLHTITLPLELSIKDIEGKLELLENSNDFEIHIESFYAHISDLILEYQYDEHVLMKVKENIYNIAHKHKHVPSNIDSMYSAISNYIYFLYILTLIKCVNKSEYTIKQGFYVKNPEAILYKLYESYVPYLS